jgi:SAM-dependent methyltransferase
VTGGLAYYLGTSYRRKRVDADLESVVSLFTGRVLDVGGARRRGRFRPPAGTRWVVADLTPALRPDVAADVAALPFRDAVFDTIKITEVLEHVPEPAAALTECRRVLRARGYVVISAPFLERLHGDPSDYGRYTEAMWRRLLQAARLEPVSIAPQGGYFTHLAGLLRFLILRAPAGLRHLGYCFFPALDVLARLDRSPRLAGSDFAAFVGGYLIVATRSA